MAVTSRDFSHGYIHIKIKKKKASHFWNYTGKLFFLQSHIYNRFTLVIGLLWGGREALSFFKSIAQFQQSIGSGRPWSQAQLQSWHISWSRCRSASTDSVVKAALACSSASRFATHLSSRHASVSYLLLLMPALFCMRVFLLLSLLYAFHICELKGGDTDFSAEPCHEKKHFCR